MTPRHRNPFVAAMGTTGTIMGTSTYLKEKNPAIQIIIGANQRVVRKFGIRKWPKEYLLKSLMLQR
jgi:cysteine synthase B